jgi:signal transduction histidine kinase/ActR/RegA family two-component response regulator
MSHTNERNNIERRVLLVTPTRRDGEITSAFLAKAGLTCVVCHDLSHLASEMAIGAGAILLTEEATSSGGMRQVIEVLQKQPAWSDLPIVLLTRGSATASETSETLRSLSNLTLLERPAPIRSVISAVESAVRGRLRQYQIRDQIEAIRIANDERQKLLESERAARQDAERVSRIKDEFLAVLSHELRTPLTPVLMTVTAMELDANLPPAVREDIEMIRRNVQLECKLIDDLLDLSRITSGKLSFQFDRLHVDELIRHVCEICREKFREKGIHLHCVLSDAGDVMGDSARLHQVFWNLLNNAAKFTPEGGDVYVTSELRDGTVRLIVRDTGIGIAPEILPRIFEAFEQGELRITRQFGGLGLGLAISRALVESHHGTIRAQSDGIGCGSSFVVALPALQRDAFATASPTDHPAHEPQERRLRVMLVEDHADTALVLSRLLSLDGHMVQTAGTATEALALAGEHTFDLVISDLGLPDMTGYDLMKQIKSRHGIKGIAMSGYGMEEDIRRSRGAGFSDHIVKPVTIDRLEQSIRRVALNGDWKP